MTIKSSAICLGGSLCHKAEIQMLISLAEAHGIRMAYNDKNGEVTIERGEGRKTPEPPQPQSFAQMQRTASPSVFQPDIDYVKLANALTEPVSKAMSQLANTTANVNAPKGQAITYGGDTVCKVSEEELDVVPSQPSGTTDNRQTNLHYSYS